MKLFGRPPSTSIAQMLLPCFCLVAASVAHGEDSQSGLSSAIALKGNMATQHFPTFSPLWQISVEMRIDEREIKNGVVEFHLRIANGSDVQARLISLTRLATVRFIASSGRPIKLAPQYTG